MILRPYYQGPVYTRLDKGLIVAYVGSGMLITLADYSAFTLFFSVINAGLLVATVGAYMFGLVVSYFLNRYWVYRKGASQQSTTTNLWRYATFLAVNLVITYAMLWALENWLVLTPYIGKFVVGCFMFFWVYLGNQYWVFRGQNIGPIKL